MKLIRLAIASLAVAALALPLAASAQSSGGAKGKPYEKDAITQGKKDGPAVLAASGAPCTMTDAAFVGSGTAKDEKGKEIKQSIYEVSCSEGLGYMLVTPTGQTPKAYDCIALMGSPSLTCRLPENADPKRSLQPVVSQVGPQCTISDARYLGSKPTGENFYEVGCGAAPGFVLETAKGQAPTKIGCDQVPAGSAMSCKFTTQAQLDAASNAVAAGLLTKSGKTCQLVKSRSIGRLASGDTAYEVACQNGMGYVLEANAAGDFHASINCANAGDACKLTDSTKAESAETGTYTHLAKAGGFQCDVAKYRFIGMDKTNSEVVELQCANRPDGTVAIFPSDNKGPAKFYDCVAAGALQQTCKLSDPSVVYGKYTAALAAKGKKTCKVSNAHWLAATASGSNYIETACSDGLPGWVMLMTPAGSASEVLSCGEGKASGLACTLPGNVK